MYFFLSNFFFIDVCFTSTTPQRCCGTSRHRAKLLPMKSASPRCIFFFTLFAGLDDFLLTGMAYDSFVAICHPLHFTVIRNPQICGILVLVSWAVSVLHSLLQILMVLRLSFCRELEIPISVNSTRWSNLLVLTTFFMTQ